MSHRACIAFPDSPAAWASAPTAQPTAGLWHLGEPASSAQRARADESPLHDIRLGEGGRIVPFHAAAHEIVTIMVALAPSG